MSIAGNCQVCNKMSNSLVVCAFCGAGVCVKCIDHRTGACIRCKGVVMRD